MIRAVEYYMFEVNRDLISAFTDVDLAGRDMVMSLRTATSLDEYMNRYRAYLINLFQKILSVGQSSRTIRLAQRFIQEHCSQPIRLEQVAQQVGLSSVYFSTRFKEETGMGFTNYVNLCRIQQARDLLENSDMTVSAISKATGFSTPRYFSTLFKKLEGVNPSEYRAIQLRKRPEA